MHVTASLFEGWSRAAARESNSAVRRDAIGRSHAMRAVRGTFARTARWTRIGLVAAAALSCTGKDPYDPGSKLGTFHVAAKLSRSTCGQVPDPWNFDVRLNHDGSTLYWVQGGVPVHGTVDTSARAELKAEVVQEVRRANAMQREEACSIARADVLSLVLMDVAGTPTSDPALATSFRGNLVYSFTPTEGSDCVDQTAAFGGDFAALPCEVLYDVAGALQSTSR